MLMIAQLLYSKQTALALKGFGFLDLLPAMVARTQQKAIAVDNVLVWNAVDALAQVVNVAKERERKRSSWKGPNPVTPLTQLTQSPSRYDG
jgi:hypothetical protein